MAHYCIILETPAGLDYQQSVWRRRVDAVRFWAHHYVYEAFDFRGLRDSRAAWKALRAVYAADFKNLAVDESGRRMFTLDCGEGYRVIVNAGRA